MQNLPKTPADSGFEEVPSPEPDGIQWTLFRTAVVAEDFSDADLSNSRILRTLLEDVNFRRMGGTNVILTWNDFNRCDFTQSDLRGADLRCSIFRECCFENADLSGVDLRRVALHKCHFRGAHMQRALLTRWQRLWLPLSAQQRAGVIATWRAGEIPPGG